MKFYRRLGFVPRCSNYIVGFKGESAFCCWVIIINSHLYLLTVTFMPIQ